jgi:hypothetical protein
VSGSAVGLAVAAAVCVGLGSALQHQAATAAGDRGSGTGLLWRLARSPRWMAGLAAAGAGTLLHAAALHYAAVAVVEGVMVANLAVALPARGLLDRARPPAGLMLAAVALSGGVAVFAAAARPGTGQPVPDARGAAVVIAAGVTLAGLCSAAAARTRSRQVAGMALGLAAGILYGLAGGILKAVVRTVLHGNPLGAVTGWPLWALAVLGAWAFILHQRAYTRAPLQASLPALSVANPLAGMAFGALAFGEIPASGPLAMLGEMLGMAVIVGSVAILGRLSVVPGRHCRGKADAATIPPQSAEPGSPQSPASAARR